MQPPEDPDLELKLRQVFIRRDESLSRDCIRTLNVLRGQSKCSSIDATQELYLQLHAAINRDKSFEVLGGGGAVGTTGGDNTTGIIAVGDGNTLPAVGDDNTHVHNCIEYLRGLDINIVFAAMSKYIAETAPITINITPATIGLLCEEGIVKSAFEVNKRGDKYIQWRKDKEAGCFLGLYNEKTSDVDRPKYGALNFLNTPGGIPSARGYGAWQLTLKKSVRPRCTLAGENTHSSSDIGVLDFPSHILQKLTDAELVQLALVALGKIPFAEVYQGTYREVQIHGSLLCGRDIEALHVSTASINEQNTVQPTVQPATNQEIANQFSQKFGVPIIEY